MKRLLLLLICFAIATNLPAQKSSSRSKTGSLTAPKPVQKSDDQPGQTTPSGGNTTDLAPAQTLPVAVPAAAGGLEYQTPFLVAEVSFTDPSDNNSLDAGEEWLIHIKLTNIGKMAAEQCEVRLVQEIQNTNVTVAPIPKVPRILPGELSQFDVKIKASEDVKSGKTPLKLTVLENRGFDLEPELRLTIPTREFQPPVLEVADYVIQDQNRNSKIEKREMVDVVFRVQNTGASPSYATKAVINLGTNVLPIDVPAEYDLGDLKPGEYKDITAAIVTNARTTEVTMTVALSEKSGKYSKQKFFTMPFDVVQKNPDELAIAAKVSAPAAIPEAVNMKLDIADNIPTASKPKENGVAVIIGNKNYEHAPDVDFAINDARIV